MSQPFQGKPLLPEKERHFCSTPLSLFPALGKLGLRKTAAVTTQHMLANVLSPPPELANL